MKGNNKYIFICVLIYVILIDSIKLFKNLNKIWKCMLL